MRALILSILLIVLISIGLVMGKKVKETFENAPSSALAPSLSEPNASISIPAVVTMVPQVDVIQRGLQEQAPDMPSDASLEGGNHGQPGCSKNCHKCPDMSKYIRMDEIPCWNCTLP